MLKHYLASLPPDSPKFTISTFGFGYDLDSRLLDEIADIGQGTYGFIPDSGMIGTVFIHAVANLMATWARDCTLDIELSGKNASAEAQVEVLGALPVKFSSRGASIQIGDMQYGQSRDIVVKLPVPCFKLDSDCTVSVTATYSPHTLASNAPPCQTTQNLERSHEVNQSIALQHQVYRLSFVHEVSKLLRDYHQNEGLPGGSQIEQTLASHTNNPVLTDHEPSTTLTSDITSQVILGLQPEHWSRWGMHYIPSLARSHQRQQCSNFKDPGLQVYGRDSPLFTSTRDAIDKKFDSLPPPKPSLANQGSYYSQNIGTSPSRLVAKSVVGSQAAVRPHIPTMPMSSASYAICKPAPRAWASRPRARCRSDSRARRTSATSFDDSFATSDLSYAPVSSMAEYNSRSAPCFASWCLVDAANGQKIKVSDLRRGTTVVTPTGTSRIAAVLRTICPGGVVDLCLLEGLAITPWHPIEHHGRWEFPATVCELNSIPCDYVYSILLEPSPDPNAHALCVGGVWCVTLGHGCTDSIRAHTFLGDYARVVSSLSQMRGYSSENGVIDGAGVIRDDNTGLLCGFRDPEAECIRGWKTCDGLQWVTCEV